jgi:quercetin dioxygenase-like cupin family protein
MKVTARDESMDVRPSTEPERFTGEAGYHLLHTTAALATSQDAPGGGTDGRGEGTWNTYAGNVSMIRYAPGARTHWHSHSGGQLIYVVEGEGWVQARGEQPRSLGPGDSASIAPGEVHWHGAKAHTALAHLAVTTGKPTWFEESELPAG